MCLDIVHLNSVTAKRPCVSVFKQDRIRWPIITTGCYSLTQAENPTITNQQVLMWIMTAVLGIKNK